MSLAGKTILVTGSTDGLGRLVAASLAGDGACVLLHGRDQAKGEAVLAQIKGASRNPDLEFHRADLASLDEVRDLAKAVLGAHDSLDVLINNAGVALFGDEARQLSADGLELHFQVNYLAPFLLTELLAPTLRASAPARIVNVSSLGQAAIDFDNVMLEHDYSPMRGYCQSKLAQFMNTIDLAEALKNAGVTATALHPGTYMNTNMVIGAGIKPLTPVEEGVEATRRLAVSPEVEGRSGLFYNQQTPAQANAQAYDHGARHSLRQLSLRLSGLPAD
jgi:NAD(P)-dependent dehydrogenase (short-subunit alcohol dehydrogenase family)